MISIQKCKDLSWIAPAIVFSLALALFSVNLNRAPLPDELHHALAAQFLLETGRPVLAEGEYWRGILHTWMVAISYEVFGESLVSARIPAVLLVAFVAPLLFLWVRREAGYLAAWLTAAIFVSSPFTVEIAQFSRFYALQIFAFVLGSMCVFYTVDSHLSLARRVLLGVLALVAFALSISAQITTLIAMVGIAVWIFGLLVQRLFLDPTTKPALRRGLTVTLLFAGIAVVLMATMTDVLEWAWSGYRQTPLFNADSQNEFWFYHVRFLLFYPTLWPLVGILAIFAIIRSPRLAWLAICIFSIGFLLMSFAGPKATRYFSFAPPYLAIVWGIGLAQVMPLMFRYVADSRIRLIDAIGPRRKFGSMFGTAVVIFAGILVVLTNSFWLRTATMIGNIALPIETPATDWRAAREALAPWIDRADIMITTEELGAIYFLGRSDVRLSPSKLDELAPDQRKEFGIDFRTGRPIITKPASLEQLIICFPHGIITGPVEHWGSPILVSEAFQAVIQDHAKPIEVPRESHLYAWGWTREPAQVLPEYCSDLSHFSRRRNR